MPDPSFRGSGDAKLRLSRVLPGFQCSLGGMGLRKKRVGALKFAVKLAGFSDDCLLCSLATMKN